jgi:hypothetical protein
MLQIYIVYLHNRFENMVVSTHLTRRGAERKKRALDKEFAFIGREYLVAGYKLEP